MIPTLVFAVLTVYLYTRLGQPKWKWGLIGLAVFFGIQFLCGFIYGAYFISSQGEFDPKNLEQINEDRRFSYITFGLSIGGSYLVYKYLELKRKQQN